MVYAQYISKNLSNVISLNLGLIFFKIEKITFNVKVNQSSVKRHVIDD